MFHISVEAYKTLRPILRKTKTRARIIERHGMPFYLFRYRGRKIFAAGVLLCLGMLFYTSRFVWNIEINGNSYLSEETILEFLTKENADFGTKISAIDCAELEEALRSSYPEIIWTSIKIYGTKMTVDIQESLLAEQSYHTKKEEALCDIIAAKDGIITYMVTRHGTPFVKPGEEVKAGDCLVSAQIPINSDYGDVVSYFYECADADIYAQVVYEYEERISSSYQEKSYIEEPEIFYGFQIGDLVIENPFRKSDETLQDKTVENIQLCFGKNFYVPVFLKKFTWQSYRLEEKKYSDKAVKKLAEQNFLQYLTNLEEKGIQIIEKNVMIKKVNDNYLVSGTITVEESITAYRPTNIEGQIEDEFN